MTTPNNQDSQGTQIKPGDTLERVVDGKAVYKGQKYTVVQRKWNEDDEHESLVAETEFINELLWPGRALEYRVVQS